jgi:hypothetical protein
MSEPSDTVRRLTIVGIVVAGFAWFFPEPIARLVQAFAGQPNPPVVVNVVQSQVLPSPPARSQSPAPQSSVAATRSRATERELPKATTPQDMASRYLNPQLRTPESSSWPWAVIVFGEPRADDIASTAVESLSQHGRETVTLFRNQAAERELAAELFRGSPSLGADLNLGKYCARLLVGHVKTTSLGATDGLIIVRATVDFRLLTPRGEILSNLEVAEKGGGLTENAAADNAINSLRAALPDKLSDFL